MKSKEKKTPSKRGLRIHFLSNLGGSLKATAKNRVTTARVKINT